MSSFVNSQEAVCLADLIPAAKDAGHIRVRAVRCDSRHCAPGDLFVAIPGTRLDGHDFAADAAARGAAAIVAQRPLNLDVPTIVVDDARQALGEIAQRLAGHPSRRLTVIGVTGTNGKTTTSHLVASILRASGRRVGLLSTLEYCDGSLSEPAKLTTPPAESLADWLSRMVICGCTHAVVEVSSHAVAQRRIAGIEFSVLCLTNLRRDHLDYHGTLADYHQAKLSLFAQLAAGGTSIYNADDPACRQSVDRLPGRVLSVSSQSEADVTATLLERLKSEQTFLLTQASTTAAVRTAMIGDHHLHNCLVAAAAGSALGLDMDTIVQGLEAVTQVPGRLERIECGQPFGAFVDFAHTPDALAVSLDTLREVTVGRLICVFGAGGNRDTAKRPEMGRAVDLRADVAIVTTDNPRFEDPRTIAADVMSGFAQPGHARWIPDRREAIRYALSLAGPDDCVLVAGRGHEAFQVVGRERIPLDDRDLVRRALRNRPRTSQYGALASVSPS